MRRVKLAKNHRKKDSEVCEDDAMEVKRAMLLNAMSGPGGIDTSLTASAQPVGAGAEHLNEKKRT